MRARSAHAAACTRSDNSKTLWCRWWDQAPVEATVYEMERLRCNACGQVYTGGRTRRGIGPDKYDATATAMIAATQVPGTGVPFTRASNGWKDKWGFPCRQPRDGGTGGTKERQLPSRRFDQLIWQAAQGEVLHRNDDTGMLRILQLAREPSDKRTGIFTSGISVSLLAEIARSLCSSHRAATTARRVRNLADLLQHRAPNRWACPFRCAMPCTQKTHPS